MLRPIVVLIIAGVVGLPFTLIAAIASAPLLRNAEARWGIELIGHSGPADWLLWVIWIVISAGIAITIWPRRVANDHGEDAK